MSLSQTAIGAVSAVLVTASAAGVVARTGAPVTADDMKSHFVQVGVMHEAVIRGDLQAARAAAAMLAKSEPTGLPPSLAAGHQAMRALAGRVASATEVNAAAAGTAALLGACGDCHRATNALVTPALPARPTVGQAVGHMLDHQRATDQLMHGLVEPSAVFWRQGAEALRVAPLSLGKLPKDPKLTADAAAGEQRLHALANQAANASEQADRVAVYGQVLATCAGCHSVHSTIWGPTKK